MFKNKLVAAGILSLSALALSVPAMATMGIGNRNYSGRYACRLDDGAGAQNSSEITEGGVTGTYVVYPNGMGGYNSGELLANATALWGDNPCTFILETYGETPSSYWVDSSGVAYETLNWEDVSMDACYGYSFTLTSEAALSLPNPLAPANQTKTTSNVYITIDETPLSFAGTGDCASSAN